VSLSPHSAEAEWSVIGMCLTRKDSIAEVIGSQIEVDDFFRPDTRLIYETAVQTYYAGDRVDPVTVGERIRPALAAQWGVDEGEVSQRLYAQAAGRSGGSYVLDHAKVVKRHAQNRRLLLVMEHARQAISEGQMEPEEVGDLISTESLKVIGGTKARSEIMSWMEVGREYVKYLRRLKLAREQGIELAAYTGLKFVDTWTKGIAPTELMIVGGVPGVGKSALTWKMGEGFARRQMAKPEDKRIGTLVLSLEMGLYGSSGRLATSISGVEGDKLREGALDDDELGSIIKSWKNLDGLPLYFNFASNFKMSQLRALVVEAIRRHNVGLVIVDHFRMFDPDRRINNANQEDEAKARFLKEEIAKDLNVAVVCLAHTVKIKPDTAADGRPQLSDLRGSGQVAAHCDIVAFMHSPWMYATEAEKDDQIVSRTDAELIFRKNRSGELGSSEFFFEPAVMAVRDVI
jgi:replicative DNA helicase